MEDITFRKLTDEQGRITEIEMGGMLILENAPHLKKEILSAVNQLSNRIKIRISNPDGLDLSCIQLLLAFINYMDENHVTYVFEWTLDEEQKTLLENVGLSNELFIE